MRGASATAALVSLSADPPLNYPQDQTVDRSLSCQCFELTSSADQFSAGGCCRLGHGRQRTKVAGTLPELLGIQVAIVLVQASRRREGSAGSAMPRGRFSDMLKFHQPSRQQFFLCLRHWVIADPPFVAKRTASPLPHVP